MIKSLVKSIKRVHNRLASLDAITCNNAMMVVGERTRVFIQVNILKQHVTNKNQSGGFDQNKE